MVIKEGGDNSYLSLVAYIWLLGILFFSACVCVCFQAILREGLEEVKHFFSVSSSCRLPLNPALLVKAINIQVSVFVCT